ncbi:MAG TPA: 30S ribosome-binding factor RbfA [Mycobacteriales bacterium]|jgi:ribosome-binding factor A|nr:30S ribosome-binding factor RbfA [Mycobacteriales bacterium]
MVDVARARKLAVRIREVVATTLELQVKDPRLGMVTITDAKLTPDLREATLYYTVFGDDRVRADSAAALESAKGVLRTQVGRQTGVRYTPSLAFVADIVPQTTGRLEELLEQARLEDARVQELASAASPAGEPDPYRAPRVPADEDPADDERPDDERTAGAAG